MSPLLAHGLTLKTEVEREQWFASLGEEERQALRREVDAILEPVLTWLWGLGRQFLAVMETRWPQATLREIPARGEGE